MKPVWAWTRNSAVALAVLSLGVLHTPAALDDDLGAWVQEKMRTYHVPGVAVAIVHEGKPILLEGYGLADVERKRPMEADSVVRVGSVSKALTATLALITSDRGALGLHEDLRPLLRDLPLRPTYDIPLTLHDLLTFTGCFDESLMGQHSRDPDDLLSLEEFLRQHLPPRFAPPGTVSSYNDFQTSLAGLAIARARDEDFSALARRDLFELLGMHSSRFRQTGFEKGYQERLARAYEVSGDEQDWRPYPRDYIATTPAAGLWTTPRDMAVYMRELLARPAWRRQYTPQWAPDPRLPGWGYGFAQTRRAGREVWFKDGQASGFHARMLLVPDESLGVFAVHNRNIIGPGGRFHDASRLLRELGDYLLETHFPAAEDPASREKTPPAPRPVPGAQTRRAGYLGTYRTTVQSRDSVERLIAMLDEQAVEGHPEGGIVVGGVRWVEVEPGVFQYAEGGPHHVAFVRSGEERLYFYPYGSRTAYERVPFGFGYGITVAVLSGAALLALVALPAGALALRRASRVRLAGTTCASLAHGALLIAGLAAVAGTFGFADPQRLFAGMPLTLRAGLTALDASVVLLGLLMILLGRDYSRGQLADRRWTRLLLTGYCLGQAGALPWLVYWQLV